MAVKKHTITIQISDNVYAKLKSMAEKDRTTRIHIIRRAITVLWEIRKHANEDGPIEFRTGNGEVKMLIL